MKNRLCFLIDDDADDREIFELALENINGSPIDFASASGGKEAMEVLNNPDFFPNYIFLDLNMPGMNGKLCLKEIKKLPHLKDVPVVIYSTSSNEKDIIETNMLGAADYMRKPSSLNELRKMLAKFFCRDK